MPTIMLFVEHPRERQILKIICESYGYSAMELPMDEASLPQLIQYAPEALIMELPSNSAKQLSFLQQMRKQPKTKKVRTLVYGNIQDQSVVQKFVDLGKTSYYPRPLNTLHIRQIIRPKNMKGATLHRESKENYEGDQDVSSIIMDPETKPMKRLRIMTERIGDLLAFPFTIAKVLSVTQSSTTGASDLAQAIEIDPVVVSAILKVANSALYGRAGSTVTSIKDAIVRLGFIETKNIAVSLSVMMLFSDEENSIGFDREEFWYHSLSVAVIAGKIGQKAGFKQPETPFVCGLLHDFGIILLDEFFPEFLFSTLRSATQKGVPFLQEEKERWGITHNDIVSRLFEQWNMPSEILLPLQHWEEGLEYDHHTSPQLTMLVHIVRVAEIIAKSLELGHECDEYITPIPEELFSELKLNSAVNEAFFQLINNDMNMFSSYLQLNHTPFSLHREIPDSERVGTINFIDFTETTFNPVKYYLIAQQYQFQYETELSKIRESETPPDIVIIHCNAKTTTDDLEKYSDIVIDENLPKTAIPLLVIGPEPIVRHFERITELTNFLPDTIDLRVLTFSIQKTILGGSIKSSPEDIVQATEPQKLSISTRIINKNSVVLALSGDVSDNSMPEFKKLLSTLLAKTQSLVMDFHGVTHCSELVLKQLDEFRKAVAVKGVSLVLCSIGNKPSCNSELFTKTVLNFSGDQELINHIHKKKAAPKKLPIPEKR